MHVHTLPTIPVINIITYTMVTSITIYSSRRLGPSICSSRMWLLCDRLLALESSSELLLAAANSVSRTTRPRRQDVPLRAPVISDWDREDVTRSMMLWFSLGQLRPLIQYRFPWIIPQTLSLRQMIHDVYVSYWRHIVSSYIGRICQADPRFAPMKNLENNEMRVIWLVHIWIWYCYMHCTLSIFDLCHKYHARWYLLFMYFYNGLDTHTHRYLHNWLSCTGFFACHVLTFMFGMLFLF